MDHYDNKILQLLSGNGRITGADIARKINLSLPAVTERLRKLDRSGYIDKYTIKMNRKKLELNILAFIQVWIDHSKGLPSVDNIIALNEVLECHHVTGDYDYLLKIIVRHRKDLETFLMDRLTPIPGVARIQTNVVLDEIKSITQVSVDS